MDFTVEKNMLVTGEKLDPCPAKEDPIKTRKVSESIFRSMTETFV